MSKSLEDRLADIADESEAGEEDQTAKPISAHVKVTRGHPRSRVLQVRLNPDEYTAIERIAERRGLPASTVAREELLRLVAEEGAKDQPLVALVALADKIKAVAVDVACDVHLTHRDGDQSDRLQGFRDQVLRSSVSESRIRAALGMGMGMGMGITE